MWSFSNLYTDEGRKHEKEAGKEFCDMFVVFGNDVIIFSVKFSEFNRSIDTNIAWGRWYRKTIKSSVKQIFGAELWLHKFPDQIYLDKFCKHRIPIEIPNSSEIRVHRIVVALGIYEACKEFYGGESIGSLIVNSALRDDSHFNFPINVGHVCYTKGFVHVLEDFTLDAVLRELDTISDFISYLSKKEKLLSKDKPTIVATGEEQLLSIYLTHTNSEDEHDFVLPKGNGEPDYISFDESFWPRMVNDPQYRAKKQEDEISYAWDRLIEHFIKYGEVYDENGNVREGAAELENGLRLMASEPRIRRRQLAHSFIDLLKKSINNKRAVRVFYSNDLPDQVYIFLILPRLDDESYEKYRSNRRAMLFAYCHVAKLRCINARTIIGIATENIGSNGASEDLVVLDVTEWTSEKEELAKKIQREASLLLDQNVIMNEGVTPEYPDLDVNNENND